MTRSARLCLWALAGALALAGAAQVRIDTDINRFILAGTGDSQLRVAEALQRDAAGRTVLIALRARDEATTADASRALAASLRASPALESVHNGEVALAPSDVEFVVAHRYAFSDRVRPAIFDEGPLRAALRRAAGMLQDSRAWLVEQLLPRDPTLETLHIVEQWRGGHAAPRLQRGVWFTTDGRALLIATTRAAGDDATAQLEAAAAVRAAAAPLQAIDGEISVQYSGLGMLAAEAQSATRSRVERLGIASGVLVTLILWLGYRRVLPVLWSLLPVVLGLAAGTLATFAVFGDVNLLALAFACILIDEGSDYPSYLLTQARTDEQVGAAAQRVWPTLRLAVLTSVAAFAVLLLAQFRGLQQMALLCGCGLLVAGAAARWLVPDLLGRERRATWTPPRMPRWLSTRPDASQASRPAWLRRLLPLLGLALPIVTLASLPLWNDDVSGINPLPRERIALDRDLRVAAGFPAGGTTVMFSAADAERVLQAQEAWWPALQALLSNGEIAQVDMAARLLPSRAAQAARVAALPPAAELRARLQRAVQDTDFDAEAFAPFIADVSALPSPAAPQDVPAGLLRQRIAPLLLAVDGRWTGLVHIEGRLGSSKLLDSARAAGGTTGVDVAVFDPRQRLVNVLHAVRERLVALLAVCIVVVAVVIAVHHRSPRLAGQIMLPVVTALLLTAAAARLLLGPMTVFNVVALLLLLGVLTNYSLFVHAPPPDDDAMPAGSGRAYTVFSLLVASGTTLTVFGALAASGIVVVEAVGRTVVVGIIIGLAWIVVTRPRHPTAADRGARAEATPS